MAISFPILFGLMFGDVGHGLILLGGGLGVYFALKKQSSIKNMAWIIAMCGLAAIIAGLIYGEMFGDPIHTILGFGGPLWFDPFSPTTNVFRFLIFALYIGVAQITLGIVLEIVNFGLAHRISDAILIGVPKLAFYGGAVFLVSVYQLNIASWFPYPVLLLIVPFIFMVISKPVYVAITAPATVHTAKNVAELDGKSEVEAEEEETTIGQSIFESGDLVTRFLSNTISYTRILALLMAHWALVLAVYTVAGLVSSSGIAGLIIAGVIVVGGNLFVIALEGLIVFIHTLRLHFYEWFTKFYKGTGTAFEPFKQKYEHTILTLEQKKT
jgi:V/A-type H+-transporting ATPase subunit I